MEHRIISKRISTKHDHDLTIFVLVLLLLPLLLFCLYFRRCFVAASVEEEERTEDEVTHAYSTCPSPCSWLTIGTLEEKHVIAFGTSMDLNGRIHSWDGGSIQV